MLEQQVSSMTGRYRLAEDTIHRLNEQLEELMHAKTEHENRLVANFVQVLNEKKLKIRNQQRLLASATVDSTKGRWHKQRNLDILTKYRQSPRYRLAFPESQIEPPRDLIQQREVLAR